MRFLVLVFVAFLAACSLESPLAPSSRGLDVSALPHDWCENHPDDLRCPGVLERRLRFLTTDERWALMDILGQINNVDPFCINLAPDVQHIAQGWDSTQAWDGYLYVGGELATGHYDWFTGETAIAASQFRNTYDLARTVVHEAAHRYFGDIPQSEDLADYAEANCVDYTFPYGG